MQGYNIHLFQDEKYKGKINRHEKTIYNFGGSIINCICVTARAGRRSVTPKNELSGSDSQQQPKVGNQSGRRS